MCTPTVVFWAEFQYNTLRCFLAAALKFTMSNLFIAYVYANTVWSNSHFYLVSKTVTLTFTVDTRRG